MQAPSPEFRPRTKSGSIVRMEEDLTSPFSVGGTGSQTHHFGESPVASHLLPGNHGDLAEPGFATPKDAGDSGQAADDRRRQHLERSLQQLGRFIPSRMIQWHFDRAHMLNDQPNQTMFMEEFEAATLFADISGFSELAESLEKGKRASLAQKGLAREIEQGLSPLVAIVLDWGGDIIKFAGDAIFVIFPVEGHGGMQGAVTSACLAARQIAKFLLLNVGTGVRLTTHCGVGAGRITGYHIGGILNRWEYAIAGSSLVEAINAEKGAGTAEVVVSDTVYRLIKEISQTEPVTDPSKPKDLHILNSIFGETLGRRKEQRNRVWDDLKKFDVETLRWLFIHMMSYIPRPVIQAVDSGQSESLGEVRICTIMFIKLKKINPEDVAGVHNAVRIIQKRMYSYPGSSLCRVIADDKGLGCLWAFGMPPTVIEQGDNVPFRAVVAAMSVHEDLNEQGLSCSAGLTSGRVFCGTVGHDLRGEYTLHGTLVNLAARLMGKAEDGLMVDDNVYSVTKEFIAYDPGIWTNVKGKQEPIVIYRPTGILPSCQDKLTATTRMGLPQVALNLMDGSTHIPDDSDAHDELGKLAIANESSPDANRRISGTTEPTTRKFSTTTSSSTSTRFSIFGSNAIKRCMACGGTTSNIKRPACAVCGGHRWAQGLAGGGNPNIRGSRTVAKVCLGCGQATGKSSRECCKVCGSRRWLRANKPSR